MSVDAKAGTKHCGRCDSEKPFSEFGNTRRSSDGLQWWCKNCMRTYEKAWSERNKHRNAGYGKTLREKHKQGGVSESGVRKCSACGVVKAVGQFSIDRTTRDGRNGYCRVCCKAKERKRKYKITKVEFEALLEKQAHLCASCHDPFSEKKPACVDHDARPGKFKVRGLLCKPCNFALGLLKESVARCYALASYIDHYCGGTR